MQSPVGPRRVVMAEELPKGSLQVASAEDKQMIQALPASRSHPSLGERVRLGCPDRRLDDLHAFGAEDLVEWAGEFRVSVPDQESRSSKALPHCQVPSLLGHPRRVGVAGGAEDVHPSGPELDRKQYVQGAEPGRLHREEVKRHDP